jgi:integrase
VSKKRGNGEGSITRRKDGRYMARYTVHTATGTKRKTVYGKTRAEVSAKLTKAMADRDGGVVFDSEDLTIEGYLERWLADSVRDTVRPRTYEANRWAVQLHICPALGRIKLSQLTPAHVQGLYRSKLDSGLSPATVHKVHTVLHKALKQAMRWSLVPRNVTEAVTPPRPAAEEMRPLSPEEAQLLLKAARNDRLEALYVLVIHTGMRLGELLGLSWEDVDLERRRLQLRHGLTTLAAAPYSES